MSTVSPNFLRPTVAAAVLLLADCVSGILTALLSFGCFQAILRHLSSDQASLDIGQVQAYGLLSTGLFVLVIGYFLHQGHYGLRTPWWQQVAHILSACLAGLFVSELVVYAWKIPLLLVYNGLLWLLLPVFLIFSRHAARLLLIARDCWALPTTLIGGPKNIAKVMSALRSESYLNYDLKRAVLPDAAPADIDAFRASHGQIDVQSSLPAFVPEDCIFFCPDDLNPARHEKMVDRLAASGARFAYVPPIDEYFLYNARLRRFFGYGFVALESARQRHSHFSLFLKETLDKAGAALVLLIFAPFFLAIAWAIRRDGGPALYGHMRIGKGGRPFKCWKFRSMIANSQEVLRDLLAKDPAARAEYERDFKLKNDPRITKIGGFLRKTSLDEIPQLFNVLRGEMSLMGPRPIVEDERKFYEERMDDYVSVRPGMTGLWQVSGRSDTGYDRRVYLDSWYVKNWSLWNDIIIVFKTILVVVKRKGAY